MLRTTAPMFLACLLAQAGLADDWPQWLGPQRDGVWRETGIIERFPADGPRVKWRVPIAGGYAGPAVAAGRVYVMDFETAGDRTGSPNDRQTLQGRERILCFSSADGKLLWKHEYDCSYNISYPAGPRATPTVEGGRVYALGAEGNLTCLDAGDGSVVWSRNFQLDFGAETPFWGHCGHPLVVGDLLICMVGGEGSVAVAFDKQTGKEVWRALSAPEPGYCPPTLIEAGGQPQLLIWHSTSLNSLDPRTGKVYWSEPLECNYKMSIVAPRQQGDLLFAGGIVNQSVLLRLDRNRPAAEVVWRGAKDKGLGPVHSSPIMDGEWMYGVDRQGELRCVRLSDGEHQWSTFAPTTGGDRANSATAFLVKNGSRYFLFSETGDLVIARLTPQAYEEISRAPILEPTSLAFGRPVVWSHPAFAERCVFARNDKELVCVSLAAE
ncbi:MAG: PQQ-like beta-propeller repeat protein [Pirellulaceae bacterium]|nr:PQQ-like beta-propeller repeat protein [Pirellulaceae bacterium]